MKGQVLIRPYEERDEASIVSLVQELQDHEAAIYDRMSPSQEIGSWYVMRMLRDSRSSGGDVLVAEHGGNVVGYASLLVGQSSDSAMDEVRYSYAYIGDLIVTRSARGTGIGKALLLECERLARAAGEQWLRVTVLSGNSLAREAYKRAGFESLFIDMEKHLR
jgi:ribosomal protein S18 acetylase RimI-like enzyme